MKKHVNNSMMIVGCWTSLLWSWLLAHKKKKKMMMGGGSDAQINCLFDVRLTNTCVVDVAVKWRDPTKKKKKNKGKFPRVMGVEKKKVT